MLLPCENDQAKPDRFSRLACSTLLSKIRESGPPERCPWDRGLLLRTGVLELIALLTFCLIASASIFCANFLKLSNFPHPVKLEPR